MKNSYRDTAGERLLFDSPAALRRLGGDRELLNEFIEIFFEDSPILLRGLEAGLESGDVASVQNNAHALKGMLSNFGAEPCVELALELERAGRSGILPSATGSKAARLRRLWVQLCDELRQFQVQQTRQQQDAAGFRPG